MNIEKAMSQDMRGRYADELIDSAIPAYEDQVRFPDVATYDPLARIWQMEELDDYIENRKEAFDTIEQHRCKRTTEAIVDGTRKWICDVCSPAYGLVATVMQVHDTQSELKEAA